MPTKARNAVSPVAALKGHQRRLLSLLRDALMRMLHESLQLQTSLEAHRRTVQAHTEFLTARIHRNKRSPDIL